MTDVLQMAGFLTFLQTEVAKVRVGGERGLLVLPGVVGDRLVDTLHRLQQLGGNYVKTVARDQSSSGVGEKVGLCQLKWRGLCFFWRDRDCSQAPGQPPTGQLTGSGSRWAQPPPPSTATPPHTHTEPLGKALQHSSQSLSCISQSSRPLGVDSKQL